MTWQNIRGSIYHRAGLFAFDGNNRPLALYYFNKSINCSNSPVTLYTAGMLSLLYLNDDNLALDFFRKLEKHPAGFVAHMNAHIADCLIRMNRKHEALYYLTQETRAFPISVIAFNNKLMMEKTLCMRNSAEQTAEKLLWIMMLKNITPENFRKIRQNPILDGKYDELNK
jgi:hypothetical protein